MQTAAKGGGTGLNQDRCSGCYSLEDEPELELDVELELELDDEVDPDTDSESSSLSFHAMDNVLEQYVVVVEVPDVHDGRSENPFSSNLLSLYIMIINESNELRRVAVIVAVVILPAGKTA